MRKVVFIFLTTFLLILPPLVSAKEDKGSGKFSLKIMNLINGEESEGENNELNRFEIMGEISQLDGTSFVIGAQTIKIDPILSGKYKQKGIIEEGVMAKVKGIISSGMLFATDVKIISNGQGRFKLSLNELNNQTPTPTPEENEENEEPDVTPTLTPSPTLSPTPTSTASANFKVKVKANGPYDLVVKFLEQVLEFLQNLII